MSWRSSSSDAFSLDDTDGEDGDWRSGGEVCRDGLSLADLLLLGEVRVFGRAIRFSLSARRLLFRSLDCLCRVSVLPRGGLSMSSSTGSSGGGVDEFGFGWRWIVVVGLKIKF